MATKNSINSDIPIEIEKGGTAAATHTPYAVLCGGTIGLGSLQSVASVGTSGQVLTSNGASTLPTFQTPAVMSIEWQQLASDPVSPINGQVWYNTTTQLFKGYANSTTVTFTVT